MVSTMPKQLVVYVAFVAWMLGVSGCASRSYEVKAIDEQKRAEAAKREAESRLEAARHAEARAQKELSAAKIEAEKNTRPGYSRKPRSRCWSRKTLT